MQLAPHEVQSSLWTKLTEHYTPLLAKARARNENPLVPEAERLALCYQIKFYKEFLALAEEPKTEQAQP